jgi:hypothetical protein
MMSATCFEPQIEQCVLPNGLLILIRVKRTTCTICMYCIYNRLPEDEPLASKHIEGAIPENVNLENVLFMFC